MERIACTYEDIRLPFDQLEAGIEREGNYTVRRSNLSRSIDDASSNKLVAHSSRILFFLSFRSIDFFHTRLPSLRYEISADISRKRRRRRRRRYTLLYIISFPYSAIGLHSRAQSFIIFRWKKGGQKYTEYPRARRHPVDYFENIIAKRGEEKRGRRNGEEMEKGQAEC